MKPYKSVLCVNPNLSLLLNRKNVQNVQFLDEVVIKIILLLCIYIYLYLAKWTRVLCCPACVGECVGEMEAVFVH